MNRKFTLIIVFLMLGLTAWAGPVSRQQAKQNVQSFIASQSKSGARGMKRFAGAPQELTMELAEEIPAIHICNPSRRSATIEASEITTYSNAPI